VPRAFAWSHPGPPPRTAIQVGCRSQWPSAFSSLAAIKLAAQTAFLGRRSLVLIMVWGKLRDAKRYAPDCGWKTSPIGGVYGNSALRVTLTEAPRRPHPQAWFRFLPNLTVTAAFSTDRQGLLPFRVPSPAWLPTHLIRP
jgi:hypothetical protein